MKKNKFIKPFLVWDLTISIVIWALINWQGLLSFTFTFSSAESWILFFWILLGLIIFFTFFALIFNIKKLNIFLKFTKVWFLVFYFIFSAVLMSILAAGFIKG